MRLLKIKINNFLSIQEANLNLQNKGLVAIQGINKDGTGANSNGAGKTTMGLAILWCNWGSIGKDVPVDDVVHSKFKKNCFVECHWQDETTGIEYLITRYRKHSEFGNSLTFQIKHPEMEWQDETGGTTALTQNLINKALGMNSLIFRAACFAGGVDTLDIPAMTDKELKELLEGALPLANIAPVYQKYKKILTDFDNETIKLENNLRYLNGKIEGAREGVETQKATQISYDINQSYRIKEAEDKVKLIEEEVSILSKNANPTELISKAILKINSEIHAIDLTEYMDNNVVLKSAITRRMSLEEAIKHEKASVRETCPTCNSPIDISGRMALIENYKKDLEDINKCIVTLAKKVADSSKPVQLKEELERKSAKLHEKLSQASKANQILDIKKSLLKEAQYNLERVHQPNPYLGMVQEAEENLAKTTKEVQVAQDGVNARNDARKPLEAIVEALGPQGYRYHLLEQITPLLNNRTNYYLTMLTDGNISAIWSTIERNKAGEFKEKFSIKIDMNGRSQYGGLSGGQQRKVKLACFLALQDVIAQQAEKSCSFFMADEIDHALDSAGIERLMTLLEEKARQKETILVISHNDLQDFIPAVAYVSMQDEVSTITGVLND